MDQDMNLKNVRQAIWTLAHELDCEPREILGLLEGVLISEEDAGHVNKCDWKHPTK